MPDNIWNGSGVVVNKSDHVLISNQKSSDTGCDWVGLQREIQSLQSALQTASDACASDVDAVNEAVQAIEQKNPGKLSSGLKKFSLMVCGMVKDLGLNLLADYLRQFMPWA